MSKTISIDVIKVVQISGHMEYIFECTHGREKWFIQDRYKHLEQLHKKMQGVGYLELPRFPKKKFFIGKMKKKALNQRTEKIRYFFQGCVANSTILKCEPFQEFLSRRDTPSSSRSESSNSYRDIENAPSDEIFAKIRLLIEQAVSKVRFLGKEHLKMATAEDSPELRKALSSLKQEINGNCTKAESLIQILKTEDNNRIVKQAKQMETKYKNAKREMNKILHAYVTKEKNFPILRISDTDKEKNKNKSKKNKNKRSNRRGVRKTDTEQSIMQDGEPNVLDTSLSNQLHVLAKERSNKGSQSSQMQQQYVDQDKLQQLGFTAISKDRLDNIEKEEEEELRRLEKEIIELVELFQDVAALISQQQDSLNHISKSTEKVFSSTQAAIVDLSKAAAFARMGLTIVGVGGGALLLGTIGAAVAAGTVVALVATGGIVLPAGMAGVLGVLGVIAAGGVIGVAVGGIAGFIASKLSGGICKKINSTDKG